MSYPFWPLNYWPREAVTDATIEAEISGSGTVSATVETSGDVSAEVAD